MAIIYLMVMIMVHVGEPVMDVSGELVCTKSFPSMPSHFWNDPDGAKYKRAYFSNYPGRYKMQ